MSRRCSLTGKSPLVGNHVSHSKRAVKRVQKPNLITKRIYIPEANRTIALKLSARALRTVNKKGAYAYLKEQGIKI